MKKFLSAACAAFSVLTLNAQQTDTTVLHSEIVVTGTRNPLDVRYLPLTITQISGADLERNYNSSVLETASELTPGLFTTSRGIIGYGVSTNAAGSVKVRGVGSMAQLLVLIDGQPQFAGLMGHPIPDAYQSFNTEKVEIIRGPASLLYGSNAMGGVINIVTKNAPQTNGVKTDVQVSGGSFGTFEAEGAARVRQGRFSSVLGVSYQRTDGHRKNSEFDQLTDFIKLGYDLTNHWTVSGDINLTNFQFTNPGSENAPLYDAEADISRGLTSVSVSNNYAKTSGTFRAFYDWGYHEINDGHLFSAPEKDNLYKHKDFIGGINAYQSVSFFNGNRTTFGFDFQTFGGKAWNDYFDNRPDNYLVKDKNQTEISGCVDFRQELTSWFSADLGLRVDNHSQSGTEIVPQIGLSFYSQNNDNVKLLFSKGFRNPTIREMYMFPPQNDGLKPERLLNYEIYYSKRISNLQFETNVFYLKGDNLIVTVPKPDGAGKINKNVDEVENSGFEFSAKYALKKWRFAANYSYLYMTTPVEGAPKNKLFVSAGYNDGKFSANLSVENVSGLYLTEKEDENYTLLNANFGYNVLKWLKIFVKGENLLSQKYQTYSGFYMPEATFFGGIKLSL